MLTSQESYDNYSKYLPKGVIPVSPDKYNTMIHNIDHNHADRLMDVLSNKNALALHRVLTFDINKAVKPGDI